MRAATTIPTPTPANTVASSAGVAREPSRAIVQAEPRTSTPALATPATKRSTIQPASPSGKAIAKVTTTIVARPKRTTAGAECRVPIAKSAPTR